MGCAGGLLLAFAAACALFSLQASAYYVPGTYPQEFKIGDRLQAQVSSLTSFDTELPFDYYSMPFCKPEEGVHRTANTANPGTVLSGTRIENSPYNFTMKIKQTGMQTCGSKGYYGPLTKADVKNIKHKIDEHYRVNMVLDNLPVTVYDLMDENAEFVRPGFELGYKQDKKYYINNHLVFNILVYMTHGEYTAAKAKYDQALALESLDARRRLSAAHRRHLAAKASSRSASSQQKAGSAQQDESIADVLSAAAAGKRALADDPSALSADPDGNPLGPEPFYMVVGFEVSPCSIARDAGREIEDIVCGVEGDTHIKPQEVTDGAKIVYTYDVYWQDSKIKWASRWDAYLRMPGGKVHWFAIVNSLLVVVVMATIVAMILIRTVRRDLAKYEQLVVDGGSIDMKEEAGWKLVAGDAFRPPANAKTLAVQLGTGVQVLVTSAVTLLLATLGFLSPASRGALVTTMMIFFVLLSALNGFVAVYMWGIMQRSFADWHRVAGKTSVYFNGITMAIFTLLNMVIKHTGSSGAVPVGMYFGLVAVWFLISIPLCFMGGMLAIRCPLIDWPVKTNQIPRHIPPPPVGANPHVLFIAAGILPFGTVFIELYFAMTSVWLGYFYYLFGFVFIIGGLMLVINAEISILCTYVQLCAEDYLWWWRSFHRGGSVAMYIALYALGFLASSMTSLTGSLSVFIYLCYMTIVISGLYFAMGTVGFAGSFWFVYAIFKAIKSD